MVDTLASVRNLVPVLEGIIKHCRKDDAKQLSCHDAALLCAVVDRELVGDGIFIDDTAYHDIVKGADDVNNHVGTPHLTEDLP